MRPVCVTCKVELRCDRNGVAVLEMTHVSDGPPAPYRLWHADRWKCPGCGQTIISGFAQEPLCYAHNATFDRDLEAEEALAPVLRVYDRLEDVPPDPVDRVLARIREPSR